MILDRLFDRTWKRLLGIAAILGIVYLPSAARLTYYRDDWYYAYDALVGPAGIFRALFASDRPARGPFFELYYALFGMTPLPYHLAMYFWRLAGGLAVVWLFSLLWPRRKWAGLGAGLLFALYPGFTWWVAGIEYQPMVASAALMVVSLALTIQALHPGRAWIRITCIVGAIATGWIYLSLVDYAAGIEVLRLCLIYVTVDPARARTFGQRVLLALRSWLIYLIIPAGFAVWRFVIFTSERKATDLGTQLGGFLGNPVSTALHWLVNFLLSFVNVAFSAWVQPLVNNFFSGPLREVLVGLLLALAAGILSWLMLRSLPPQPPQAKDGSDDHWPFQALWLGLIGLVLGILPIIVANRVITFPNFSHYALPGSLGLVLAVTGFLYTISDSRLRTAAFAVLVLLSAMAHQGLGSSALQEERTIATFWQQMAWRAPAMGPGTTLMAYYPGLNYADDTDIVWGPANYIYNRAHQARIPVEASISALTLDKTAYDNILLGRDSETSLYRAHTMMLNYDQVLVLAQSAADGCVRALDARWPMLSTADDPAVSLLAASSHVEDIQATAKPVVPPPSLFGPEPKHGWCYYFEKAALAAQQGNWQEVADLQSEAGKLGLHPNDQIEWMPFLQAQAYLGNQAEVKDIATRINTEKLYKRQACQNLTAMSAYGYPLPAPTQALVNELFCAGKP